MNSITVKTAYFGCDTGSYRHAVRRFFSVMFLVLLMAGGAEAAVYIFYPDLAVNGWGNSTVVTNPYSNSPTYYFIANNAFASDYEGYGCYATIDCTTPYSAFTVSTLNTSKPFNIASFGVDNTTSTPIQIRVTSTLAARGTTTQSF
jgi:hypothetical protein